MYGIKNLIDAYNNGMIEGMNVALNEYINVLKDNITKELEQDDEVKQEILQHIDRVAQGYADNKTAALGLK